MYKILIPIKEKSDIHGLWRDNGKTYFDKIKIVNTYTMNEAIKADLCNKHEQLALFYIKTDDFAYCYTLKTKEEKAYYKHFSGLWDKKDLKAIIKLYLKLYGGLTIYKEANKKYRIEVYY